MSGALARSYSVSEKVGKVLAALYAYYSPVLGDLDYGEMTGVFHVAALQVRPKLFHLGAGQVMSPMFLSVRVPDAAACACFHGVILLSRQNVRESYDSINA
jgi:hypothetical protein